MRNFKLINERAVGLLCLFFQNVGGLVLREWNDKGIHRYEDNAKQKS